MCNERGGVFKMQTLISYVNKWAITRGEQIAISDEENIITYKELKDIICKLQKFYLDYGLERGDIVGIACIKDYMLIAHYLALFGLGISIVPLPCEANLNELTKIILDIKPKYIIISSKTCIINQGIKHKIYIDGNNTSNSYIINGITELISICESIKYNKIVIKADPVETFNFNDFIYDLENENEKQYFNLTSGSTANVKIANVSTSKIIANAIAVNDYFILNKNDNYCCMFSTDMHPHELFARSLIAGCGTILLKAKSIKNMNEYIVKKNITQIMAVPSIYNTLLDIGTDKKYWNNVKYILSSGEPTNYILRKNFYSITGKKIIPVWGSTETTGVVFYVPERKVLDSNNYIGIPFKGYQVKIDDNTSELLIKGKSCFDGYRNEKKDNLFTLDGYYKTKDIAEKDENNIYKFCGRTDDIVKINGRKINLALIKNKLESLQFVHNIEIVHTQTSKSENILGIFCVKNEKKILNDEIIRNQLNNILNTPIRFEIINLESMPTLSSNKINRQALKNILLQKLSIYNR